MKNITRTIPTTEITVSKVQVVNGKVEGSEPEVLTFSGEEIAADKASKYVAEIKGKNSNYAVLGINVSYKQYEITLADFVAHAKLTATLTADEFAKLQERPAKEKAKAEKETAANGGTKTIADIAKNAAK